MKGEGQEEGETEATGSTRSAREGVHGKGKNGRRRGREGRQGKKVRMDGRHSNLPWQACLLCFARLSASSPARVVQVTPARVFIMLYLLEIMH